VPVGPEAPSGRSGVSFLIVGSPRSGTTLVQRLAGELAGVAVPFETHFFTKGVDVVRRHGGFPVGAGRLDAVLDEYLGLDALDGCGLTAAAVRARMDTDAPDAWSLFDAVARAAAGDAPVLGEKTPGHAAWAARLAATRPDLKVVGVVRDPRAVVASLQEVPWTGSRPVAQAVRWCATQEDLEALRGSLDRRFLLLRYEDVVAAPDAARSQIAALLGVDGAVTEGAAPAYLEWETWKQRTQDTVTADRVDRWREVLDPATVDRITFVAGPTAARFGYDLGPVPLARRLRLGTDFRLRRQRRQVQALIATERARSARVELGGS
jgi:hypothetical protein